MKTIELLNKVMELGIGNEEALAGIDAILDDEFENRKPMDEEEITEDMARDIVEGLKEHMNPFND